MFLILIAPFYLAFAAYFGPATAWRTEAAIVVGFIAAGLLGTRMPFALIVGYSLHGLWDLLHELQAHGAPWFAPDRLTAIPLAYGVFCAAFDFCMAAYISGRRAEWVATWKGLPQRMAAIGWSSRPLVAVLSRRRIRRGGSYSALHHPNICTIHQCSRRRLGLRILLLAIIMAYLLLKVSALPHS